MVGEYFCHVISNPWYAGLPTTGQTKGEAEACAAVVTAWLLLAEEETTGAPEGRAVLWLQRAPAVPEWS
ncbi:hypothetical protein AOC05_13450 [Arthrobacter alpinus]|uniref:Uncharacterized protein n=1 Tax=Arthrobacter alpinus TaxID=656366 RepID=A0A0M4QXX2_9MICC|nr:MULTISPECIES: hypothetical protein [Arthrobacter]ALE93086.1 hypothetical protein AOC05_13450 [Arthrobacter alpinus]